MCTNPRDRVVIDVQYIFVPRQPELWRRRKGICLDCSPGRDDTKRASGRGDSNFGEQFQVPCLTPKSRSRSGLLKKGEIGRSILARGSVKDPSQLKSRV
ncbi:hypothetical protein BTUL_0088g00310 [Botrytis tulipae]|uniref:Uncharacterized protein n=1 Tax=Botrytis tulipae TaxID=87230 RepID=A0A4Z1EIW3_9HELO|nr:hypothetical protein BTUL_0088g00310 [Botrytis tulipae]